MDQPFLINHIDNNNDDDITNLDVNHSINDANYTSNLTLITASSDQALPFNEYIQDQFLQSIRTPAVLRSVNPDAFTPLAVAIGPLHRNLCNDVPLISAPSSSSSTNQLLISRLYNYGSHHSFAEIERYKDMAVKALLGSSIKDPSNRADYIDFIRKTEIFSKPLTAAHTVAPEARIKRFYSFRMEVNLETVIDNDDRDGDLNSVNHLSKNPFDLQSILIRDSCFVVEMMRSLCNDVADGGAATTPSAGEGRRSLTEAFQRMGIPTRKAVQLDLMLLENQVPLFVVKRIMAASASFGPTVYESILCKMVKAMATKLLPFCKKAAKDDTALKSAVTSGEHLLDCLHRLVTAGSGGDGGGEVVVNIDGDGDDDVGELTERSRWRRGKPKKYDANVPCATELYRAGVKFVGHSSSLQKVSFEGNRLRLPVVRVDGDSERMFRNLLAHETRGKSVVVLSYLHFMNGLIDTAEDVAILVKAGVLSESLGDHEGVAQMWNRLTVHAPCYYTRDYYHASVKAHKYVKNSFHVFMYEFQQEYLSRPWLVVSLICGAAELVMTFLIMYYTILLYNHDTSQ